MESEKNTNAIDLQHLWKLFVQHVRMILIWTVGLGVIAWGIATFVIPAKYTATTQILVNQRNSNDNNGQAYNNQQADIQMINTYKDQSSDPKECFQAVGQPEREPTGLRIKRG